MLYIASDHTGFELKKAIIDLLKSKNIEAEDCGAYEFHPEDDYPDFVSKAARAVSKDPSHNQGIVIGGSGEAEMMTANKFKGVRCGLFYSPAIPVAPADVTGRVSDDPFEIARLMREHNDANMISLSARFLTPDQAMRAVEVWLETTFGGGRHERRLKEISDIENINFK